MAKKSTKTKKKLKNRIAIILDRSSSMMSIRKEALDVFNQQVKAIVEGSKDMDTKVSLVTFATQADEPAIWNESASKLKPLKDADYMPDGMTAMYDAVGRTVDKLKALPEASDKDTSFLMVIISDGQENNSKEITAATLAERIKALQDSGRWTFTYLGANQDLGKVSQTLGIHVGNMQAFVASSAGTTYAANLNAQSTANYMGLRSRGVESVKTFYKPDEDLKE